MKSSLRRRIGITATSSLTLAHLLATEASARRIPVAGRWRGVAWASTPTGIAIQASVAVFLAIAFFWLLSIFRLRPYRRKGRRSFLEDPTAPMPTWNDPPLE